MFFPIIILFMTAIIEISLIKAITAGFNQERCGYFFVHKFKIVKNFAD